MKRSICLLFAFFILLTGCQSAVQPTDTQSTTTSQTENTVLPESTTPATTPPTTEAPMDIYQTSDPTQDDVLNILLVGNSGCYYYVEELYGMLEAAGKKANVCNVYYDGCRLQQHWVWLQSGESKYQYFITNENGRVKTEGVGLEWCLQQQNWDVIALAPGGQADLRTNTVEISIEKRHTYLFGLYGYFREQFPYAKLLWQQPSAYQVGYARSFNITSIEDQRKDVKIFRELSVAISERYNVGWVPRGDAAMLVREGGYDNLCARLGKGNNNEGDFYHDGDWGGGQYLTACVWYEVLTGLSCADNPYRPEYLHQGISYTLSDELVQLIQQSAHTAITQM